MIPSQKPLSAGDIPEEPQLLLKILVVVDDEGPAAQRIERLGVEEQTADGWL